MNKSIIYTTIVIGKSGRIYDLGVGEYPGSNDRPSQNAFVCLKNKVPLLKRKRK